LKFKYSELDYVDQECIEGGEEFEHYYRSFCFKNNISIEELEAKNREKVEKHFPPAKPPATEDKNGRVKTSPSHDQTKKRKIFQGIFREIAKKIHPDKFSNKERNLEMINMEEKFKMASYAMDNEKWGLLLEVAEEFDIHPTRYEKVNNLLRDEISDINKKIIEKQQSYSWHMSQADAEPEKDQVIISFLKTLFNYIHKPVDN